MKRTVLASLTCLVLNSFVTSKSEVQSVLQTIDQIFSHSKSFYVEFDTELQNMEDGSVNTTFSKYSRKGDRFFMERGGVETIQDGKVRFSIDHKNKIAVLGKAKIIEPILDVDFAKSLESCRNYGLIDTLGFRRVHLQFDNSLPVRDMWIYMKQNQPKKLVMDLIEDDIRYRLRIDYKDLKINQKPPASLFETKKYLTKSKTEYYLNSNYSDYKFYNLLKF